MILKPIFISFSLTHSNFRLFFPKCRRLHPYLTFLFTKLHILRSFFIHIFYYICIFILIFNILLILFQYIGPHKTSIHYSIFPITPTPDIPTLSHPHIHWIPNPTSSLVDIHPNSQPILSIPNLSLSNLFQLPHPHPNPNPSNPNISYHSFGILTVWDFTHKISFILLPTFLHDKWQLANKILWFNDVLLFHECLFRKPLYTPVVSDAWISIFSLPAWF